MRPTTIWERIARWFAMIPLRLAYRIIWLSGILGSRTAQEVQRAMWDAGIGVPVPRGRDPNEPWQPRYTAAEWESSQ